MKSADHLLRREVARLIRENEIGTPLSGPRVIVEFVSDRIAPLSGGKKRYGSDWLGHLRPTILHHCPGLGGIFQLSLSTRERGGVARLSQPQDIFIPSCCFCLVIRGFFVTGLGAWGLVVYRKEREP